MLPPVAILYIATWCGQRRRVQNLIPKHINIKRHLVMPAVGSPLSEWINAHTVPPTLSSMENRKEPRRQNPSSMHFILLLSHQLGHLSPTHPDQGGTGAVGNPEGFLPQVLNRLWQLRQQGKQSPKRNTLDVTYWLQRAALSLSSVCTRAVQPAAPTESWGSTAAAAQDLLALSARPAGGRGMTDPAPKNHRHPEGPRLFLLFPSRGALSEGSPS